MLKQDRNPELQPGSAMSHATRRFMQLVPKPDSGSGLLELEDIFFTFLFVIAQKPHQLNL